MFLFRHSPPGEQNHQTHRQKVHAFKEDVTMTDVIVPFALQMRLIPLTRSGMPSTHHLQSGKEFGYTTVSFSIFMT
jgi:hypothetical protein